MVKSDAAEIVHDTLEDKVRKKVKHPVARKRQGKSNGGGRDEKSPHEIVHGEAKVEIPLQLKRQLKFTKGTKIRGRR